jgi:transposase InsO family protein
MSSDFFVTYLPDRSPWPGGPHASTGRSHSRPHVSDDNPYSEAQFKTLKYQPDFPARFDSIENARAFCQGFFAWYNHAHRLSPASAT